MLQQIFSFQVATAISQLLGYGRRREEAPAGRSLVFVQPHNHPAKLPQEHGTPPNAPNWNIRQLTLELRHKITAQLRQQRESRQPFVCPSFALSPTLLPTVYYSNESIDSPPSEVPQGTEIYLLRLDALSLAEDLARIGRHCRLFCPLRRVVWLRTQPLRAADLAQVACWQESLGRFLPAPGLIVLVHASEQRGNWATKELWQALARLDLCLRNILSLEGLCYFLKGLQRAEIAAKGLRWHPCFGCLQDWDCSDIRSVLQQIRAKKKPRLGWR